jgi:uncharacterized damage-inducible protein DinB
MRSMSKSADHEASLRRHLDELLAGGSAHADFETAVRGVPEALRGARPRGVDHSLWQLLEHLRLAQWDILEFTRNPRHVSPEFPRGYWPPAVAPDDAAAWEAAAAGFRSGLDAMRRLVADPATDLFTPLPHGEGQTVLREAQLVADHNAYHLGQFVHLRRLLGDWPPPKK